MIIAQPKALWRQIKLDPNGAMFPRYDTIIEVIDPNTGVLVGMRKVTGYPQGILGDRYVATYREVSEFPVLDIWRIDF